MVGHKTLDLAVEVRILPRQLTHLRKDSKPTSAEVIRGRAWVAGATNKELHVSDGREMVSAPGPKDSGSELAGF